MPAFFAVLFSLWLGGTVLQGEGVTKGIPGGETPKCFTPTGKLSNANCPKQSPLISPNDVQRHS